MKVEFCLCVLFFQTRPCCRKKYLSEKTSHFKRKKCCFAMHETRTPTTTWLHYSTWVWHLFRMVKTAFENLIEVDKCSEATSMQARSAETQPTGLHQMFREFKSWKHSARERLTKSLGYRRLPIRLGKWIRLKPNPLKQAALLIRCKIVSARRMHTYNAVLTARSRQKMW